MKRLSSPNRCVVAIAALMLLAGCGDASEQGNEMDSADTPANVAEAIVPAAMDDSVVAKPIDTVVKTEPTKPKTEIKHQSEDDSKLDSIKKAKRKDKVPVNREISHGSENDNLLDSIKQAKRKGKK